MSEQHCLHVSVEHQIFCREWPGQQLSISISFSFRLASLATELLSCLRLHHVAVKGPEVPPDGRSPSEQDIEDQHATSVPQYPDGLQEHEVGHAQVSSIEGIAVQGARL